MVYSIELNKIVGNCWEEKLERNQEAKEFLSTHQEPRPPGNVWCQSRVKSVEPERKDKRVRQIHQGENDSIIKYDQKSMMCEI